MDDETANTPEHDPLLAEVMRGLAGHLGPAGSVVSADPLVLAEQFRHDGILVRSEDVATAVERLVDSGWLRRTVVRGEPHLSSGQGQAFRIHEAGGESETVAPEPTLSEQGDAEGSSSPASPADPARPTADDRRFRLEVEFDVERERLVLWRTVLVIEVLGLLVLLRQWGLWYLDL